MTPPAPEILAQLETLELDPARPLIISDADEVLLRFMAQLEHFLEKRGLWIDLGNFAISGNIKSLETNEPVEVPDLIDEFFDAETRDIHQANLLPRALCTGPGRRGVAEISVQSTQPAANAPYSVSVNDADSFGRTAYRRRPAAPAALDSSCARHRVSP